METDGLLVLNELCGIYKHRFIPLTSALLDHTRLKIKVENCTFEDFVAHKPERFEDGATPDRGETSSPADSRGLR